jgi:phage shock protein E
MNWSSVLILGLVLAAVFGLRRLGLVSAGTARQYLKAGALVVDVRTVEEFKARHLSNAVNIPLGELHSSLPHRVSDRNHVLLLYCLSGTRSGIARRMLKGMGYQKVFNLGSLGRAKRVLNPVK